MSDDHKVGMAAVLCVFLFAVAALCGGVYSAHSNAVKNQAHYAACTTISDVNARAFCLSK